MSHEGNDDMGEFFARSREEGWFATVRWSISDIHSYREGYDMGQWTDEEATDWLASQEGNIQDRMTEKGWDVISMLMKENGNG